MPDYEPREGDEIVCRGERIRLVQVEAAVVHYKGEALWRDTFTAWEGRCTLGTWRMMWRDAEERRTADGVAVSRL